MRSDPTKTRSRTRILVLAPNSWTSQWVNRQQIFSRIGRHLDVLYSTGGWFTWDRDGSAWKEASWWGSFMRRDNVWIDQSPRLLLRSPRWRTWDRFVMRLQARRWKRGLDSIGHGPLILYVFHPMFLAYVGRMNADVVVYHAYDLYDHTPDWTDALERAERALIQDSDLVLTASEQIADALRAKVDREIRVLPNGADFTAFEQARHDTLPLPADLSAISRPRLGWVGSLHPQVDYGLVAELAKRRPDWNFVLVGVLIETADPRAEAEIASCRALPNVHFLGAKPASHIARYLVGMDVNLMFYRLSASSWISAGYPLKLHEYLATGHPVVSADVPSVRPFSHVVRIADGVNDWHAAIEDALLRGGQGSPQERIAVAAENSWAKRVETLEAWLTEATEV
ncbi:MAG: hypothetical protein C0505_03570 [Leptothrix sp. (in: Bacteria)]|nr:hypothetical protein [Leptothrix sp. (in: b-proteobacteria)]